MHFCFICQEDFSESLSYAAKQQVFYCCVNSNIFLFYIQTLKRNNSVLSFISPYFFVYKLSISEAASYHNPHLLPSLFHMDSAESQATPRIWLFHAIHTENAYPHMHCLIHLYLRMLLSAVPAHGVRFYICKSLTCCTATDCTESSKVTLTRLHISAEL